MFSILLFVLFALWIAAFVPKLPERWNEAIGKKKSKDKEGQVISLGLLGITALMALWMLQFLGRLLF